MVKTFILIACFAIIYTVNGQNPCDSKHQIIFEELQELPEIKNINEFIVDNLIYPETAKKDKIEGRVFVSCWIDTLGYTSEHKIVKGIRKDLDDEALRVAKLIKFDKPAMNRGKPIGQCFQVYIAFKLTDSQYKDSIEELSSPPEKMPVKEDLCRFVLDRIIYPQEAVNDTVSGIVLVDFQVGINGGTTKHRVVKGVRDDLDEEALRVAKLLTFDEPAYTRNKAVGCTYIFAIHFYLNYDSIQSRYMPKIACEDYLRTQDESIGTMVRVESTPIFNKEDVKGLLEFIVENVREVNVPEDAKKVVVKFLVDTLGYTLNHEVVKGYDAELDKEALRVSRLLKFEHPAMQRGKPVNFTYTIAFDFKKLLLDKKKAEDKKQRQRKNTNYLGIFIETAPEFKGSLTEFIADNIDYPETARTDSVGGTVIISYWIDIDGSTYNHKIERGIRKDLDNEALRVTKLIHYNKPATQKGKPIKVRYVVPVKFNLPDSVSKIVRSINNTSVQN